jgi:hypothetical protein
MVSSSDSAETLGNLVLVRYNKNTSPVLVFVAESVYCRFCLKSPLRPLILKLTFRNAENSRM